MVEKAYEIIDKIEKNDFKKNISDIKQKISNSSKTKKIIEEFNSPTDKLNAGSFN